MDITAQFFGYMALMLVQQALPLPSCSVANHRRQTWEKVGVTAIKAAGFSMMLTFSRHRNTVFLCWGRSIFRKNIGRRPTSSSPKCSSHEEEESGTGNSRGGVYDGDSNCNIYVQRRNVATGKLYGIRIYG
jgi:lipopolysaccharide export system permease protein